MDSGTTTTPGTPQRNRFLANSLLLHLRPARVPLRAIRFTHTFGLGGMAMVLILLLMGSGLLMGFVYDPAPERAYRSILVLQEDVLFGRLIRGIHYWSANLLVIVAGLHLLRVFLTGAFHGPRRSNWLIGLGLLFSILLSAFTGYLLPWDQLSYWAITVSTEMLTYVPIAGENLKYMILGGESVGPSTAVVFYTTHSTVVPIALILLMTWHIWRVRLAGGVVLPPAGDGPADNDEYVPFIPDLLMREVSVALILIAFIVVLAIVFSAPLGEPANPGLSPNPAKAPWYFLGVQELLLHFHPLFAVVVIPVVFIAALVAVPFLRYEHDVAGDWFLTPRGKRLAAVAAIVGLVAAPLLVLVDEYAVGPEGWLPGMPPLISQGAAPTILTFVALAVFYRYLRNRLSASRNETVQALFVLLVTCFLVLTVIGIWFRGEGMALVWPWQI
ncbi:MAG: cytochrome b N-terminal domain-containing protein [Gammaproteobacteria bacterium]|nr:cytochrome b N-terminal domain-containing protein [Gammaproteobacteria bacterium]